MRSNLFSICVLLLLLAEGCASNEEGCESNDSKKTEPFTKAELVIRRGLDGVETKIVFSENNLWAMWHGEKIVGKGLRVSGDKSQEFWESLKELPDEGVYQTELDALELRCYFSDGKLRRYRLNDKKGVENNKLKNSILILSGMSKW